MGKSRALELSFAQALGQSRDLNLGQQCEGHTHLRAEVTQGTINLSLRTYLYEADLTGQSKPPSSDLIALGINKTQKINSC